jgi:predicted 3-demethylubiquinone-9 3-methyltransferase (glyoxalase superfamily)
MPKITPFLWFDTQAEEAANFYVSLFPNSKITSVARYPSDAQPPAGPPGEVMTVGFELDGQAYTALNGGPVFTFTEAVSFVVHCADQAEVDRYWRRPDRRRRQGKPVRLAEGQVRPVLADHAAGAARPD